MRNCHVLQRNRNHLVAGEFAAATNGVCDFRRLAERDADAAFFVTDDHERAEIETTAAFDHLGRTVDVNDFFDEFIAAFAKIRASSRFTASARTAAGTTATLTATAAALSAATLTATALRLRLFATLRGGRRRINCSSVSYFCHNIWLVTG